MGGFANPDGNFKFENLEPGYYALQIEIPTEGRSGSSKPAYKVRTEMDVNAYDSDLWQGSDGTAVCPSANDTCPLPIDPSPPRTPNRQNVKMPCAGKYITVDSSGNPTFSENGGSHKEGNTKIHYCDIKIVKVEAGVDARAIFSLFTDVPIPSLFKGLVIDDVIPDANPRAFYYTEKLGIAGMPVTLRDYTGAKLTDAVTDVSTCLPLILAFPKPVLCVYLPSPLSIQANGIFQVLVPSSRNNANAPSGSSIMAAVWCMTGNDPGASVPVKKEYRAITACFEALPGRIIPVDLAPVQIASMIKNPDGDIVNVPCDLPGAPELFNVISSDDMGPVCKTYPCQLTIRGRNFFDTANPVAPQIWLSLPDEQVDGPHGKTSLPVANVTSFADVANGNLPYQEVCDNLTYIICKGRLWSANQTSLSIHE